MGTAQPHHVFKLSSYLVGRHVHELIYAGPDRDHLALVGKLRFAVGEWQAFGAALLLGAERMHGAIEVLTAGDDAVTIALQRLEEAT